MMASDLIALRALEIRYCAVILGIVMLQTPWYCPKM